MSRVPLPKRTSRRPSRHAMTDDIKSISQITDIFQFIIINPFTFPMLLAHLSAHFPFPPSYNSIGAFVPFGSAVFSVFSTYPPNLLLDTTTPPPSTTCIRIYFNPASSFFTNSTLSRPPSPSVFSAMNAAAAHKPILWAAGVCAARGKKMRKNYSHNRPRTATVVAPNPRHDATTMMARAQQTRTHATHARTRLLKNILRHIIHFIKTPLLCF